ncbi:MAG TPA: hypothetical protein VLA82_10100 [Actinomycetota bacterium]|nr:hypothetical protein [Actinomycetota bacterium]
MTPRDAVLLVLTEASEPLHWTVIQDRALRGGMLDPFQVRDVRAAVHGALRELAADGLIHRHGKGVYASFPLALGDDVGDG